VARRRRITATQKTLPTVPSVVSVREALQTFKDHGCMQDAVLLGGGQEIGDTPVVRMGTCLPQSHNVCNKSSQLFCMMSGSVSQANQKNPASLFRCWFSLSHCGDNRTNTIGPGTIFHPKLSPIFHTTLCHSDQFFACCSCTDCHSRSDGLEGCFALSVDHSAANNILSEGSLCRCVNLQMVNPRTCWTVMSGDILNTFAKQDFQQIWELVRCGDIEERQQWLIQFPIWSSVSAAPCCSALQTALLQPQMSWFLHVQEWKQLACVNLFWHHGLTSNQHRSCADAKWESLTLELEILVRQGSVRAVPIWTICKVQVRSCPGDVSCLCLW